MRQLPAEFSKVEPSNQMVMSRQVIMRLLLPKLTPKRCLGSTDTRQAPWLLLFRVLQNQGSRPGIETRLGRVG
jgi:hypothetical protein